MGEKSLGQAVGENIRRVRRARGLTQAALAEASGLSVDAVGQLERAIKSPTLITLERVAAALETTVKSLCSRPEPQRDFDELLGMVIRLLREKATAKDLAVLRALLEVALRSV